MPSVILMRRRHLDNTTSFVFPKCVILKRENNILVAVEVQNYCQKIALSAGWVLGRPRTVQFVQFQSDLVSDLQGNGYTGRDQTLHLTICNK